LLEYLLPRSLSSRDKCLNICFRAALAFAAGVTLFSGSLYALVLLDKPALGIITVFKKMVGVVKCFGAA